MTRMSAKQFGLKRKGNHYHGRPMYGAHVQIAKHKGDFVMAVTIEPGQVEFAKPLDIRVGEVTDGVSGYYWGHAIVTIAIEPEPRLRQSTIYVFRAPRLWMLLMTLQKLRSWPVLTTNIMNPRAGKLPISWGSYGGCTDPGTERYHTM